jgi:hypothetical protein
MSKINPISAEALWDEPDTPLAWVVEGLIPEGATLFAGRPKAGKSYAMLDIALSIAGDFPALDHFATRHSHVLYFALEDGRRRIKRRLKEVWKGTEKPPAGLHFQFELLRGATGVGDLRGYLDRHGRIRTVIIDTLAKVRPLDGKGGYQADYEEIERYQKLAQERQLAIIIMTHTRKPKGGDGAPVDPLDEVQHTSGLTGAADHVLVMKRPRNSTSATLSVMSRDLDECAYELTSPPGSRRWSVDVPKSNDPDKDLPQKQRKVRQFLRSQGGPQTVAAINHGIGESFWSQDTTARLLSRMADQGTVVRRSKGVYDLPEQSVSGVSECPDEPVRTPFDDPPSTGHPDTPDTTRTKPPLPAPGTSRRRRG